MDAVESLKYAKRTHYTHFSNPSLPWHKCVVCDEAGVRMVEGEWLCLEHLYMDNQQIGGGITEWDDGSRS
jgi:hypothetical protein